MTFEFPLSKPLAGDLADPVGDLLAILSRPGVISFAGGVPDAQLFEFDDIRASFQHAFATATASGLQYASTEGEPALRAQAARLLSRDLPTGPEHIQITSGSQEGIFLAGLVMADEGDVILVEQPTYLAAVQAFQLKGARLVGVDMDEEGVRPDDLERLIAEHHPKFVYLIPTFQNPSGKSMSRQRRAEVAEVLRRTGTPLVEDDPYGALRFEGDAAPPIASLPGMAAQTLLLNSMSKVMAPGIRVGWIRGEGPIMKAISIAKAALTLQSPPLNQVAVAHYLATYDLDEHIRRVCDVYRVRRDAMYAELRAMLPPTASVTHPDGGMFCWVRLGDGTDTQRLLDYAVDAGVAFVPGWTFYSADPDRSTMRLSYVTNSPERIAEGLGRLRHALDAYAAAEDRP